MDGPREPILIVIIEERSLSRECLSRVLEYERQLIVDGYSSIDQWLASRQSNPALVVLCQNGLPKADALAEVERLQKALHDFGNCPAVVISDDEDPDIIVQMLGKDIRGYVPTNFSISVAIHAIDLARAGGVFVPASSLVAACRTQEVQAASPKTNGPFTARQAAVVEALRRGKANKIIAYELNMRESTVKVHVRNIMKKLHATNRTEVAFLANQMQSREKFAG